MGRFQLVAVDADGTLMNSAGRVTPGVRRAVQETVAGGVDVVLVTAREPGGAQQVAAQLETRLGAVMVNGALVAASPWSPPECLGLLDAEAARAAVVIGRELGLEPVVYDDPQRSPKVAVERSHGALPGFVEDQADRIFAVDDLTAWIRHRTLVVVFAGAEQPIRTALAALTERLGDRAAVAMAPYPPDGSWVINVYPAGCDKATGLRHYCASRDIPLTAVLAVGDGENDRPMLLAAGWGVAMGNAPAAVQQAADEVTASCDEDGLAAVLWRHVLLAERELA